MNPLQQFVTHWGLNQDALNVLQNLGPLELEKIPRSRKVRSRNLQIR